MYTNYMKDFQSMNDALDSAIKEYPVFAETLREFEVSSLPGMYVITTVHGAKVLCGFTCSRELIFQISTQNDM